MGEIHLRPHEGKQDLFLSSPADIAIYGGGAGGGKTWALLLEALRHIRVPGFGAVVFRRESVQIANEGGLWDTAMQIYPAAGGVPKSVPRAQFSFPSGARVTFGHLNLESDVLGWQGSQIPLLCFDELSHFASSQFWYMLSRNRSTCGVRPYVRATTNPDADSWVAKLIEWWIDQDSGYPIPERAGVIRWFGRVDNAMLWADTPQQLEAAHGIQAANAKSLTFIPALLEDNPSLLAKDPGYLANLKALSRVERERLLGGNWKIRPAAGLYFNRHETTLIETVPTDAVWIRAWDLAATLPTSENPDPDWSVGLLMGRRPNGRFVVASVNRFRLRAADVRAMVKRTAQADTRSIMIGIPEDPGQAGKEQADNYVNELAGYSVHRRARKKNKIACAEPVAAQWQAGNIDVVRAAWNEAFFSELESFPDGQHDDQVDALGDAFMALVQVGRGYAGSRSRTFS